MPKLKLLHIFWVAHVGRPRASGVKPVVRKSANGSVIRTDYYHRVSGVPLGSDYATALVRAAEIDGVSPKLLVPRLPTSVFGGLCDSYLASDQFRQLGKKSQTLNRLYVEKLRHRLGPAQVAGLTPPNLHAFKKKLGDELEEGKKLPPVAKHSMRKGEEGRISAGMAGHLLNKLGLVMSHAIKIGVIKGVNPASRLGGFGNPGFRNQVWAPEQCEAFLGVSKGSIKIAAAVLLYTAQRPSDVVHMTWDRIQEREDGRIWLSLTQEKTSELIAVPAHRELARVLRAVEKKEGLLVSAPRGGEWSYRNFARRWDSLKWRADFRLVRQLLRQGVARDEICPRTIKASGLQRRDLRRTAMVRMAESGATVAQIAAVSGHSIGYCQRILDRYIPRRAEVAAGAIAAWESGAQIITPTKKD